MYQSGVECHWVWIWKRWDLRPFSLRRLEGQQQRNQLWLEDFSQIRPSRTRSVYDRWQRSGGRNWGSVSRPGNSSSDPLHLHGTHGRSLRQFDAVAIKLNWMGRKRRARRIQAAAISPQQHSRRSWPRCWHWWPACRHRATISWTSVRLQLHLTETKNAKWVERQNESESLDNGFHAAPYQTNHASTGAEFKLCAKIFSQKLSLKSRLQWLRQIPFGVLPFSVGATADWCYLQVFEEPWNDLWAVKVNESLSSWSWRWWDVGLSLNFPSCAAQNWKPSQRCGNLFSFLSTLNDSNPKVPFVQTVCHTVE